LNIRGGAVKKFLYISVALVWIGIIVWKKTHPEELEQLERPIQEVLAGQLVNRLGQSIELQPSAYYLIYFSSHWCPPCREFTPVLASFYKQMKKGDNFNVIFVSGDASQNEMLDYMKVMPWPAVKFNGAAAQEFKENFGGEGTVPNLVVVNRAGKVIYRSYENDEYVGPYEPLNEFAQHLKNRPAVIKAIDMAKDLQGKRLERLDEVSRTRVDVKEVDRTPKIIPQQGKKVSKTAVPRVEKSVDSISGYTLNGIAGNETRRGAIINGKIYYTGDVVWDEVIVKEIRPKEVVLIFKGKPVVLRVSGFSAR